MDLVHRHCWEWNFPSFFHEGVLNVVNYGAVGDGVHDDLHALQAAVDFAASGKSDSGRKIVLLPRGVYAISATLRIPNGVSLIGIAKHLSRIVATTTKKFHYNTETEDDQVVPLVQVCQPSSPAGTTHVNTSISNNTTLAFLSITVWNHMNNISALHWHCNGGTTRQIHFNRASICGSTLKFIIFLLFISNIFMYMCMCTCMCVQ